MLTLFAIPKAFKGHISTIQRNAIASWTRLYPRPEVILLGNDDGTAEVAQEFGLIHIPEVGCNEFGTPLVSSLFQIAQSMGQGPLFLYVNADIILMNDLVQALQQIPYNRFLLTGQRCNLDITAPLAFNTEWESHLRDQIQQSGRLEGPHAMDYFAFTRDTYTEIPPFAIGRPCWDNWMLYKALSLNIPLIDATQAVTVVHQNHDYSHHSQGKTGVFEGPEAQRSLALIGGRHYTYFMLDLADWQLTPKGLQKPRLTWEQLDRRLDMLPLARPRLKPLAGFLLNLVRSRHRPLATISKFSRMLTSITIGRGSGKSEL